MGSRQRHGMFALHLQEHYYDPTFRALKTYYFFDNQVICLGSNIECRDTEHATETTLFQGHMADESTPVWIDGEWVETFPCSRQGQPRQSMVLLDPHGTGFYLPDGGSLRLARRRQHSRDAWNREDTTGVFTTCWLDHGHGPREDGYGGVRYEYAQLIRTTPEQLTAYAAAPPYRVLQQDHQAHILDHRAQRTICYALFEANWIIPHGHLQRTDTPVLAILRETPDGLLLSVADPDLRLPKRRNMAYLDAEANRTPARPSVVQLDLRGRWQTASSPAQVKVTVTDHDVTRLELRCRHGLTVELQLNAVSNHTSASKRLV